MSISEAEFQVQVILLARLRGWRVAHFRKVCVRRPNGSIYYETPVAADGKGFPDLVMFRATRQVAAELKVGKNTATPEQLGWLAAFMDANVAFFVWRPEDWDQIERVLA